MHPCLSALAGSSSGAFIVFVCYWWMMLRGDESLNEDPGPLPEPRCLSAPAESSSGSSIMCFLLLLDDIRVDECYNKDLGTFPRPKSICPLSL